MYSVPYLESFARKYDLFYNGDQLPYCTKFTKYARALRKYATTEERLLWRFLRQLPVKVLRQRPIAYYIVDFYIPKYKAVIEIDGSQHYTNTGKVNDTMRTAVLEELGLSVIRFSNRDIVNNYDHVCAKIKQVLKL